MKNNSANNMLASNFWKYLQKYIPRILSQLDRDKDSPNFGSFDRNYHHYKIRDFSSIILQQGILIIETLRNLNLPDNPLYQKEIAKEWVDGSIKFWAREQLHNGSFNEYYPNEKGYPPTAFSLYAVALVYNNRNYPQPEDEIINAIQKSINWLLKNPECKAMNQECAGLTGIALSGTIPEIYIDENIFKERLDTFFDAQSVEGWFPEYGGADIGYLSVTIDCLWDLYEATDDERALTAMKKAIDYISWFISVSKETPVMINSRNTNYVTPYGLIRNASNNPVAASIIYNLFENINKHQHFLDSIDDRYCCHYIYQSCFRSLAYSEKINPTNFKLPFEKDTEKYFSDVGIYIRHFSGKKSIFVACKKGGVVNIYSENGIESVDYGWRANIGNKVAVTHWQNDEYRIDYNRKDGTILFKISGFMSSHSWIKSSPFRHVGIRILSYLFGNRLMKLLKHVMIFRKGKTDINFQREIEINNEKINITDRFEIPKKKSIVLKKAPHYSLRHVASANLFSYEELLPVSSEILDISQKQQKVKHQNSIKL